MLSFRWDTSTEEITKNFRYRKAANPRAAAPTIAPAVAIGRLPPPVSAFICELATELAALLALLATTLALDVASLAMLLAAALALESIELAPVEAELAAADASERIEDVAEPIAEVIEPSCDDTLVRELAIEDATVTPDVRVSLLLIWIES